MIPLDVFKEIFPEFKEYYNELLMLRYKKKELVRMYDVYREALRAADEGTVQLMIEEQQKEIEEHECIACKHGCQGVTNVIFNKVSIPHRIMHDCE